MAQASSTVPEILLGLMLVLNFDHLTGAIHTGATNALLLIVLTFVAGYFWGGLAKDTKAGPDQGPRIISVPPQVDQAANGRDKESQNESK